MLILASHWSVGLPPLLLLVGTIWPGAGWQNNYHGKSDDIAWQLVRSWREQLVTHKKLKRQAPNEKQKMWMPVKTWNQIKKSKHGGLPQLFGLLPWRWKQLVVYFYNCKHGWRTIKEMVKICLEQLFPYSWIVFKYIWYRNRLLLTQRQVWQHVYANLSGPWTFCRHMVFGAVTPVQFYAQTALLSLVIVQWKT